MLQFSIGVSYHGAPFLAPSMGWKLKLWTIKISLEIFMEKKIEEKKDT